MSVKQKNRIKQRLAGLFMLIISIISIIIENDGTAAALLIPLALWILTTKHKIMYF